MTPHGGGPPRDPRPGAEARAGRFPGPSLIPSLQAIQRRLGWLPRSELEALARDTQRPLYELQGLVSFYPHFRTAPPPAATVAVCRDLPCWLADAERTTATLRSTWATDADVQVEEVSCLGRCELAPAVAVDGRPGTAAAARDLVAASLAADATPPAVAPSPSRLWPNDPYAAGAARYRVLRRLLAGDLPAETVVAALDAAGLRGMGGAGFPTGRKWSLVAAQPCVQKYAICNADESEPGTFKDREILATQPHLVLEGLLVGMLVTGAEDGWVFIRHEYGPEQRVLESELRRLGDDGLLGDDAGGSGRRLSVDVFTSPGGYILGEETALLECMEGHRGEPRNKPPFPGVAGLWGRPTLINSVETFAHVPVIVERGADWWRGQGVNGAAGLKFFAVSGDVANPGVHCVPLGTTVRELLELAGGVSAGAPLQAFQPGGASSNFLGVDALDTPLDFEPLADAGSMLGSGALIVLSEGRDLLAASTNVLRFFRNESCGKCVPCRVGSTKAHALLERALDGGELDADVAATVVELEEVLRKTSICGLGQVALGPVVSVIGRPRGATAARPQPRPPVTTAGTDVPPAEGPS